MQPMSSIVSAELLGLTNRAKGRCSIKYDLARGWNDFIGLFVLNNANNSVTFEFTDGGRSDIDGVKSGKLVLCSGLPLN